MEYKLAFFLSLSPLLSLQCISVHRGEALKFSLELVLIRDEYKLRNEESERLTIEIKSRS